jgi:DNA-3-methyladenine glycosylase I
MPKRCEWATADPLLLAYHDSEWGVPSHDDRHLFELLSLEGAQAGLSWLTILRKRDGYRRAFADFDAATVARFTAKRVARLCRDPAIVRHRGKIESVVSNARAILEIAAARGSFAAHVWSFVDGVPRQNRARRLADLPSQTEVSTRLGKDLARRGCRFVGPTTCYAFMQAAGLVNDHEVRCFRYREVEELGRPLATLRSP